MADQFVGEIRVFAGNFAPTGWAFCDGQLLPISQNTALFSLLGTNFGGNGTSNFALPDLRGRLPLHAGSSAGPGLTQRQTGEAMGSDSVALIRQQLGTHRHSARTAASANLASPGPTAMLAPTSNGSPAYRPADNPVKMNGSTVKSSGAGAPHNNLQPYLALSFIIALQGIFPPRS